MTATILFFDRAKGWGWAMQANPDDPDVFVHRNNTPGSRKFFNAGDVISFDLGERNGRPCALNVQLIAPAPPVGGSRS